MYGATVIRFFAFVCLPWCEQLLDAADVTDLTSEMRTVLDQFTMIQHRAGFLSTPICIHVFFY